MVEEKVPQIFVTKLDMVGLEVEPLISLHHLEYYHNYLTKVMISISQQEVAVGPIIFLLVLLVQELQLEVILEIQPIGLIHLIDINYKQQVELRNLVEQEEIVMIYIEQDQVHLEKVDLGFQVLVEIALEVAVATMEVEVVILHLEEEVQDILIKKN